jgi:membrane-bound lytic murein transglycosylase D
MLAPRSLALAGLVLLLTQRPAPLRAAPAAEESYERVGPLQIASGGRDQVRGGRPDGASVHDVHLPRPHDPDAAASADFADFERSVAPTAVLREPPEPWMAGLSRPDLPLRWSPALVDYLRHFRDDPKGQALIRGWLRRLGRYDAALRAILREIGVPEDLIFVAVAESGLHPKRRSRVGAAGLWQFMEGTGRVYGLQRGFWVDDRLDIELATYAAGAYLKDLRARFGSWEMALAAFNGGYGLVMTSISRHNTNSFWALCALESGLPQATTRYVPKILAAAVVGRNRQRFAVAEPALGAMSPITWSEVMVPPATQLSAIAQLIDEDPALIDELNARYVRGRTPPEAGLYPVRVPRGKQVALQRAIGRLQSESDALSATPVRYGETLAAVARRVGHSEATLRKLNGVEDNAELTRGLLLLHPRARGDAARDPKGAADKDKKDPRAPRPLVAVPPLTPSDGQRLVFFEATRATTPRGVAEAFGAPWEQILAWNELDPQARIQPGQVLQILVPADFSAGAAAVQIYERDEVELVHRGSAEHISAGLARRGLVRRAYRVRAGDTLEKIGARFGLTDGDLARINAIQRTQAPTPGDLLIVYVPESKTKGTVAAPPPAVPAPGLDRPASDDLPQKIPEESLDLDPEPPKPGILDVPDPPAAPGPSTSAAPKLPGKQGWKRPKRATKGR